MEHQQQCNPSVLPSQLHWACFRCKPFLIHTPSLLLARSDGIPC